MATKPPAISGGPDKVLKFVTNKVIDEIKKAISDLGKFGCAKVNKVIAELRNEGASLPKDIDKWSCDQKIAFVAALGPYGVACLAAGSLVVGMSGNAAKEVQKYGDQANRAAQAAIAKSGVDAAAKAVGNAATDAAQKLGF